MPSVTYTVTTDQLAELKLALDYHQGNEPGTATNADIKQFGLRRFQSMVEKYRQSIVVAANPVDHTPVAS